jgi:hypothetical protein
MLLGKEITCASGYLPDLSPFLFTLSDITFIMLTIFPLKIQCTMPSSTTKALFSLLGWSYIPDFVTSTLLRWARPYLRTPITHLHYRLTFAFVVLSYLVYNFFEASHSTPPNFYELLDISPASDEGKIKAAFRTFARRYHPDRAGPEGNNLFVAVREGYEALMDPNKRWAYDR